MICSVACGIIVSSVRSAQSFLTFSQVLGVSAGCPREPSWRQLLSEDPESGLRTVIGIWGHLHFFIITHPKASKATGMTTREAAFYF